MNQRALIFVRKQIKDAVSILHRALGLHDHNVPLLILKLMGIQDFTKTLSAAILLYLVDAQHTSKQDAYKARMKSFGLIAAGIQKMQHKIAITQKELSAKKLLKVHPVQASIASQLLFMSMNNNVIKILQTNEAEDFVPMARAGASTKVQQADSMTDLAADITDIYVLTEKN